MAAELLGLAGWISFIGCSQAKPKTSVGGQKGSFNKIRVTQLQVSRHILTHERSGCSALLSIDPIPMVDGDTLEAHVI